MAFQEGVDVAHVHAFRSVVSEAERLDEAIDAGTLHPAEALDQLQEFIANVEVGEAPEPVEE